MLRHLLETIKLKYWISQCYRCKSHYAAENLHKPLAKLFPDSIPKLIEMTKLQGDKYRFVRSIAYGTLGQLDDKSPKTTDVITEGIHDEDFYVRRQVIYSS